MRPVFENFSEFVKNYKIILEDEENPSLASNKKGATTFSKSSGEEEEDSPIKNSIKKLKQKLLDLFKKKEEKYAEGDSEENYPKIKPKKFYFDPEKNMFVMVYKDYSLLDKDRKTQKWEIPPSEIEKMEDEAGYEELLKQVKDKESQKIINLATEKIKNAIEGLDKSKTQNLIDPLIESVKDRVKKDKGASYILGKNIIDLKSNSYLQSLLKKFGYLKSKSGPLKNGITCYFNGETEKALEKLSGMKSINFLDEEEIEDFRESLENLPGIYSPETLEEIIAQRDKALLAKKPELKPYIDAGLFLPYYNKSLSAYNGPWSETHPWRSFLKGKKLTGDPFQDMLIFNSSKEGGLSDAPADLGPEFSCPHGFDSSTGTLTYDGKEYKLSVSKEIKNSKSIVYGNYWSDRWHTSRGVVWTIWKSVAPKLGINDALETVKKYFEMPDDYLKRVYEENFYNPVIKGTEMETKSTLVNHCLGTASWGGQVHMNRVWKNTKKAVNDLGYSTVNDAIDKIGDKTVTEIMLLEQMYSYEKMVVKFKEYGDGWTNGMLNFHRYWVPFYADLPSPREFPTENKFRKDLGENAYADLKIGIRDKDVA